MLSRDRSVPFPTERFTTPAITIHDRVAVSQVKRFGVNIGYHDRFGAAQLFKNLIVNPGFEAGEYATIFLVEPGATTTRFQADNWNTTWNVDALNIGQPPGFWAGASWEAVDGAARGRWGRVADSTHENNRYTFYLREPGKAPQAGDVVFMRTGTAAFSGDRNNPFHRFDHTRARPGSEGSQSLQLLPPTPAWRWSWEYVMDSYSRDGDLEAGSLLQAEGEWLLAFWVQGSSADTRLEVQFERAGTPPFVAFEVPLGTGWQQIVRKFTVPPGLDRQDAGVEGRVLKLRFRVQQGTAWLDDMVLTRDGQSNPTVFSDRFVNLLKELRPGILRNWGHQLGSSLENQLRGPFGRKMTGYSPRNRLATQYHFSLHEFFRLCWEVNAEPWYVIPPTFTTGEMENLAAWLTAHPEEHPLAARRAQMGQSRPWVELFPTIHLEYGNEMWGANQGTDQFLGATVRGGERLGRIACERLRHLRSSPFVARHRSRLNLIVGGQAFAPERQEEIARHCDQHDTIALAPYYGFLQNYATPDQRYKPLFARALQDVRTGVIRQSLNRVVSGNNNPATAPKVAIYELNFHTTTGVVPPAVRNAFVTGAAGGLALPFYMLQYLQQHAIRDQVAFTAAQFSTKVEGSGEYVRLWGLLRDLEATGRKRPGWLALELVNRALVGDLLEMEMADTPSWWQNPINGIVTQFTVPSLFVFPFRHKDTYAVLMFNLNLVRPQTARLVLPVVPSGDAELWTLSAASLERNNEDEEQVRIVNRPIPGLTRETTLTLLPCSLSLLTFRTYRSFLSILFR
jgi:hypothetical protein